MARTILALKLSVTTTGVKCDTTIIKVIKFPVIHVNITSKWHTTNSLLYNVFSEEEKESAKTQQTSVYDNTLDNQLPGVSLTVRTQIRQKLQGKDDTIRQLRAENEELRSHIKTLSEESHQNKERLQKLDRVRV